MGRFGIEPCAVADPDRKHARLHGGATSRRTYSAAGRGVLKGSDAGTQPATPVGGWFPPWGNREGKGHNRDRGTAGGLPRCRALGGDGARRPCCLPGTAGHLHREECRRDQSCRSRPGTAGYVLTFTGKSGASRHWDHRRSTCLTPARRGAGRCYVSRFARSCASMRFSASVMETGLAS